MKGVQETLNRQGDDYGYFITSVIAYVLIITHQFAAQYV